MALARIAGRCARAGSHTRRDDVRAGRARPGPRGGRLPIFNPGQYRAGNQIERAFNRLKQFRTVATRYDKLRVRYQATVTIASIMIWLRANPDRACP